MKRIKSSSILCVLLFLVVGAANSIFAQSSDNSNQARQTPQNKRLKITKKLNPKARGCEKLGSGVITVRVTFDKSAKVTWVEPIMLSGCRRFDEASIDAARKIRFEPEIKDGEPVTVVKTIEYRFLIY